MALPLPSKSCPLPVTDRSQAKEEAQNRRKLDKSFCRFVASYSNQGRIGTNAEDSSQRKLILLWKILFILSANDIALCRCSQKGLCETYPLRLPLDLRYDTVHDGKANASTIESAESERTIGERRQRVTLKIDP